MSARVLSSRWRAVGTLCSAAVTCSDGDRRRARAALDAAEAEVAACERELSRFDPESDLSRLNAAGGAWTPVGRAARRGAPAGRQRPRPNRRPLRPAVLPALAAAGYDRSFEQLVERPARRSRRLARRRENPARPRRGPGAARAGRRRRSRRDRQGLRGHARARRDGRRVAGLPGALVDLGGDVAVAGRRPGVPWRSPSQTPAGRGRRSACSRSRGRGRDLGPDLRRFGPAGGSIT